jgi:hypothetical protein
MDMNSKNITDEYMLGHYSASTPFEASLLFDASTTLKPSNIIFSAALLPLHTSWIRGLDVIPAIVSTSCGLLGLAGQVHVRPDRLDHTQDLDLEGPAWTSSLVTGAPIHTNCSANSSSLPLLAPWPAGRRAW